MSESRLLPSASSWPPPDPSPLFDLKINRCKTNYCGLSAMIRILIMCFSILQVLVSVSNFLQLSKVITNNIATP